MSPIRLNKDRTYFVSGTDDRRFIVWGFNYDHDRTGRLIEDYWDAEWPTVEEDFQEMRDLGANAVRVHLQLSRFMVSASTPDTHALNQLKRLIRLSEETGLYLNITGLACYRGEAVPAWYDTMSEVSRWQVQALFWEAVASACSASPAILCYDLMNEPVIPSDNEKPAQWLLGEFGGKFWAQYLTRGLAGRLKEDVARAWIDVLVDAIRRVDARHFVTVGEIPWALAFPGARPLFYDPIVAQRLDVVSVHFYPKSGRIDNAVTTLAAYEIGMPLIIEEMFPLACSMEEMEEFIERSRTIADGWFSFYWGETIAEYDQRPNDIPAAVMSQWLKRFQEKGREIRKVG